MAGHTPVFLYTVEQGANVWGVMPRLSPADVVTFYDYNTIPASSNTGLEQSDTSILFLYRDPAGVISLVMIHDQPPDGSGGKAVFGFSGVPAGTSFVVRDDGGEASLPTSTWRWAACCTDGGALSGTLNGEFAITIDASFPATGGLTPGKIDAWKFLARGPSGPEIDLDMDAPVTIRATAAELVKMTGGGQVDTGDKNHSHSFGFNLMPDADGHLSVNLEYNDNHFGKASDKKGQPSPLQIQINGIADSVELIPDVNGNVVGQVFNAPCTVRNLDPDNVRSDSVCRVVALDNGEPGVGSDRFRLRIIAGPGAGYTSGAGPAGTLLSKGNIQNHGE